MKKGIHLVILFLIIFILLIPQSNSAYQKNENNYNINKFNLERVGNRFFLWAKPIENSLDEKFPVIFLFHGAAQHAFSWIIGFNTFTKKQVCFTRDALEEGFFIITLESQRPIWPGPRAWDVFNDNKKTNNDFSYIYSIIQWLKSETLDIDINNLFGVGFSSGAFMCSRIALSDEHLFNAVSLNSGCNANSISLTNKGPVFDLNISYNLSNKHPPTMIIHGENDRIVPVQCSINYYIDLQKSNVDSNLIVDPNGGHEWFNSYNDKILSWFKNNTCVT